MDIRFTRAAQRQIGSLQGYIATRAGKTVADGYIHRLIEFCSRLAIFPQRGQARSDLLPGLRTIGFERRVTVAFVVMEDTVVKRN